MTKLPKKFEFCTTFDRATKYTLEYFEEGMYRFIDNDATFSPSYTAWFVQACVDEGSWIITKNLEEPELVFPFTVLHKDTPDDTELFVVTKGYEADRVTCTYPTDSYDEYQNCFSFDDCKRFIKDGIWIVKSVGVSTDSLKHGHLNADHIDAKALPISIQVTTEGFDETMERLEKLRQAYEDVAIAMESVIALQKEMKNV